MDHLAPNLAEIEKMADEHARLRQAHGGSDARLAETAARIIDVLSSEGFAFPL